MRKNLRKLALGAALLGMTGAQAAQAQNCLTQPELTAMVTYALPVVMDSAIKTCRPNLSAQGYFATQGPALVERYSVRKPGSWPMAKAALLKIGDGRDDRMKDTIAMLPDSALQPFAEAMVAQMVTEGIKADQCVAIERATRLLSPLPPENTAELLTFILAMADKPKPGKKSDLPLCPAN
ncbi:hypothetical protein OLX02_11810 [Novosphingobium sp. KCTC 2891]|uniref:hypothetical protein n=1 Tax=Novosphingobium sp. KCTC 2891 TaxID=2989730 RepID=UPI00222317BF|nr:hypothetical protein [Novosphingobium sp. KCTC 2891]MCW1383505.1 hypothetical protein [Novosphingobium sp. KCTC 2891]